MDFLKTLLAYMTATFVIAVESTATPAVTPVPTPAPTPVAPVVISTELPPEEDAEPAVSVTPRPVATITPNRAYHNLIQGAKGAEVKKLQEKLIELGYLPEGSADGSYGAKTKKAVRLFQYFNGLTMDGIAGRSTQTNLFENPEVMPYPGDGVPEPTPALPPEETDLPDADAAPAGITETTAPPVAAQETETPVPTEEGTAPEETEAAPEITDAPGETETAPEITDAPGETETAPEKTPAVTEAPADLPEVVEDIDLDSPQYNDIEGDILLKDGERPLTVKTEENGTASETKPRIRMCDGRFFVSLDDLTACLEGWTLTDHGGTVVLEAQGRALGLYDEDAGISATLDGMEIPMSGTEFDFEGEGHFIEADFLTRTLGGAAEWREEDRVLVLNLGGSDA